MALRFYNTLTQKVDDFTTPGGAPVRMYTCGPTVYNFVHIGNLRTFTFQDILRRWLRARGFALNHVMNITDVEDKIIRSAMAAKQTIQQYTKPYEEAFLEDCATLRLERPEKIVRATEHIPEMIEAVQTLAAKGYTYESDGSTYYSIAKFDGYGKLSHNDFSGMRAGARVDVDEYEKDDARDFVLWKARKGDEPFWEAAIGDGRPGWHIECSVMAMKYLGETLDIHAGGIDLTFPHHENEIAQSEAMTGKQFSRFWLHAEHLIVNGAKMSKSIGNFYTLRDLLALGHSPEAVRYLLASVPYRNKLNFTMDGLQAATTAIERIRNFKLRIESGKFAAGANEKVSDAIADSKRRFDECLDDDLNVAGALGVVFEFIREGNTALDAGEILTGNAVQAGEFLAHFDSVFDVLRPTIKADAIAAEEIEKLIAERAAAKKAKDFARADGVRAGLLEKGVILEDSKDGTRWKRK